MYADSVRSVEKMILDEKRIMTIKDLEAKYNKLEQDNQILLLQKQQDSARRNLYMALLGVGLLFSLLTGIYLLYHQKSKSNKILEQKNKQINLMLHEKDLLLREIHHRVKNNLQVVSSLLNLQSDHITDEIALDAINTGKTRVGSMALIHQNLYNHNNLSSIRTKEYFDDLTEQIFDTYNVDKNRIKIIKKIDDVSLDVEMMIPVGLIVNELLTNCLKHAFHHKEHGIIELSIEDLHDEIKISVKDNGPGLDIQKFDHSDSFGHKMVRAFIQKLKSELLIKNNNGAYFSFMLKKENINITKQAG
jgi:two-component sensor histidine kinase